MFIKIVFNSLIVFNKSGSGSGSGSGSSSCSDSGSSSVVGGV